MEERNGSNATSCVEGSFNAFDLGKFSSKYQLFVLFEAALLWDGLFKSDFVPAYREGRLAAALIRSS